MSNISMRNAVNLQGTLYKMGTKGYSAYEVAVQQGFKGTVDEWLESLRGPQGNTGPQGLAGTPGATGRAATVTVGTVTTGASGSQAKVTNVGTENDAILNFVIPQGPKGVDGTGSGEKEIGNISGVVEISTLSEGIYINNSDSETYLVYGENEDETILRKGTIIVVTKVGTGIMCKVIGYEVFYQLYCKGTTMNRIDYATEIFVNSLIGDISTLLDTINGEVV